MERKTNFYDKKKRITYSTRNRNENTVIKIINLLTCAPHFADEDNLIHSRSALCTQRLGNRVDYIFGRDLKVNLWLQAPRRYIVYYHPGNIKFLLS